MTLPPPDKENFKSFFSSSPDDDRNNDHNDDRNNDHNDDTTTIMDPELLLDALETTSASSAAGLYHITAQ